MISSLHFSTPTTVNSQATGPSCHSHQFANVKWYTASVYNPAGNCQNGCYSHLNSSVRFFPINWNRFQLIGTDSSSQPLISLHRRREITVTVAFTQPSSRDSSATEEDEPDGIMPFFRDLSAAEDVVTTRLSKKRGGNE